MPKHTRLDDNAQIYNPIKPQTEKEKLKDMNFEQKLAYLWEYYKLHALAIVATIALIIYFVYSILNPSVSTQFYAAVVNSPLHPSILEQYEADFADYLELDPKREVVDLNDTFYFNNDDLYTMNLKQTLSTYVGARQVDVIIAPESEFSNYAFYGTMEKLSDQLPTDIYSSLTDYFYLTDTEEDSEKRAYGIYLNDTELFKENAVNSDPYILGIVASSRHKENTLEFIRFLLKTRLD